MCGSRDRAISLTLGPNRPASLGKKDSGLGFKRSTLSGVWISLPLDYNGRCGTYIFSGRRKACPAKL